MIGNDIFRIPWKHNSRRDLGDDDVKIFKVTSSLRHTPLALFHFCMNDSCWDIAGGDLQRGRDSQRRA